MLRNLAKVIRINCRNACKFASPVTFENVIFPPNGEYKLPKVLAEPIYDESAGERKYKSNRRYIETFGVEEIHSELIHNQFGLRAVSGGFMKPEDFDYVQGRVNRNLLSKQFAIWRLPAPYIPRTVLPSGKKKGGGKGSIKFYVTPVRANRIILELGGYVLEEEARAYLCQLIQWFPFKVEFISVQILAEKKEKEKKMKDLNCNKFNWDMLIKYNMQECHSTLSPYDIGFKGQQRPLK